MDELVQLLFRRPSRDGFINEPARPLRKNKPAHSVSMNQPARPVHRPCGSPASPWHPGRPEPAPTLTPTLTPSTTNTSTAWRWLLIVLALVILAKIRELRQEAKERRLEAEREARRRARLSSLEETMDPLVARAIYNETYSPLLRLPNELICQIMREASTDNLSFYCLRQVSRRLRMVSHLREFRQHPFSTYRERNRCKGQNMLCNKIGYPGLLLLGSVWAGDETRMLEDLRARIRRDLYCKSCLWKQRDSVCKFKVAHNDAYCSGCRKDHPRSMFSPEERTKDPKDRICIGREGHIRLCDHEVITWADLEPYLALCLAKGSWETSKYLIRCCKDKSHEPACKAQMSWPGAELVYEGFGSYHLKLSWHPHTGPSAFTTCSNGHIQAFEMRSVIQRYRREGARYLLPPGSAIDLPEMRCFHHCNCLRYDHPNDIHKQDGSSQSSRETQLEARFHPPCVKVHKAPHVYSKLSHVQISPCAWPVAAGESPCMYFKYERKIIDTIATGGDSIVTKYTRVTSPGHAWYHAIDRDSYTWDYGCGIPEACIDTKCGNHYDRIEYLPGCRLAETKLPDGCRPETECALCG